MRIDERVERVEREREREIEREREKEREREVATKKYFVHAHLRTFLLQGDSSRAVTAAASNATSRWLDGHAVWTAAALEAS